MEGPTKDNDIEMARGTIAAETMMASSSNNQGESFNSMCLEHYSAAAEGDFEKFKHSDSEALAKILTPNDNTILHIHITARLPPKSSTSQVPEGDFVSMILGICPDLLEIYKRLWKANNKARLPQRNVNMNFMTGILGICPDLLWQANKKGETLLHMAARYGLFNVVEYLLQECKKIPYKNQYGDQEHEITPTRRMLRKKSHEAKDTALHEAVRYSGDHLDVVKVLTEADHELTYEANTAGETPLYLAAERGYAEVLKEILKTCTSPGDHGPYDRTALHVAVIRKDEEMVEGLLEAGEGIHKSKQDKHGWTPLHFATHLGYIVILKKLLRKDKSAAYKADNKGKTALHVAAGHGQVDIMQELISKCPDCCELVDDRGWNVLHFALESRNQKAVQLVLENPWLRNLINEKDKNGNTPFLHAASKRCLSYYDLIDRGVDIKVFNNYGVDMQVFNHQNHNATDIVSANEPISSKWLPDLFLWVLEAYKVKQGLRMIVSENDNIGKGKDEGNTVKSKNKEDGVEDEGNRVEDEGNRMSSQSNNGKVIANLMKNTGQTELVVATLIATVTFTAGFTVPGGFVADKGPDRGAAILTRNTAFRAFVILNTISMFFSCLAVFTHLAESSVIHVPDMRKHYKQTRFRLVLSVHAMKAKRMGFRLLLIFYAMMAMIGAFLSGTYAVLHSDRNLAISACVVPMAMCAYLGLGNITIKSLLSFILKTDQKTFNFLRQNMST